jgi:hypothetical protein
MQRSRFVFGLILNPDQWSKCLKEAAMRNALVIAGSLLLASPATSALAHDSDRYQDFFSHLLEHAEHQRFHQQFRAEHGDAHEQGLSGPQGHADWHRAYRATHGEFHQEHPATWHDHRGYGHSGYGGYSPYGYAGYSPYGWYGR